MYRYRVLTPAMQSEILTTCHSLNVCEDGQVCNPFETMMKQYEKAIKLLEKNDIFDIFKGDAFDDYLDMATDDVEDYEELEGEILDFLDSQVDKVKDLM